MAVLVYLPKLKKDLGLAFGSYFQHCFSIPYLFQCHTFFPSQTVKQNMLLSS